MKVTIPRWNRNELWERQTDPKGRLVNKQALAVVGRITEKLGTRLIHQVHPDLVAAALEEAVTFYETEYQEDSTGDQSPRVFHKTLAHKSETLETVIWMLYHTKTGVVSGVFHNAAPSGTYMTGGVAIRNRNWAGSTKDPAKKRRKKQ